jgi:uncharacterized protein YggU (UPF0235/DUF167 family)
MPRFKVKVIPRSKHFRIIFEGDLLKVWLKSPPVDGKANEEFRLSLAKILHVPKSAISIALGSTGRNKIVDIVGVTLEEMKKLLA